MQIALNNINLYYEIVGDGQPLIMLHGNGEDHNIFNILTEKLKNQYKIYLIDSRNHGKSSKTSEVSYECMSEDIKEFINILNIKDPYIIGFSDGAIIATITEIKYPGTFSKMAILGINLNPQDFKDKIYNIIKKRALETNDPLELLMINEPDIKVEDISKIKAKVKFYHGDYDLFKEELYIKLKKALPDSEIVELKGHDHLSYIVDNDMLYEDLIDFLG